MPLPAIAVTLYYTAVQAAPSLAPAVGLAALGIGVATLHQPGQLDTLALTRKPEPAAECIRQNVAALNTRLVASVQPLRGTETMGVMLKRDVFGDTIMTIVVQDTPSGSTAELRPLEDGLPDVIPQMTRGC